MESYSKIHRGLTAYEANIGTAHPLAALIVRPKTLDCANGTSTTTTGGDTTGSPVNGTSNTGATASSVPTSSPEEATTEVPLPASTGTSPSTAFPPSSTSSPTNGTTGGTGQRGSDPLTDNSEVLWYGTISVGTPAKQYKGTFLFIPVFRSA